MERQELIKKKNFEIKSESQRKETNLTKEKSEKK